MMNKDIKKGIQIALDVIKKTEKWSLVWEWMESRKRGEFIKVNEIQEKLISLLKNKS